VVGQLVSATRRRTGFLESAAHLAALRGRTSTYRIALFRRKYEVRVIPRRDRAGKITGVRGVLQAASKGSPSANGRARTREAAPPELRALQQMTRRRQRNSMKSAIRSLELAKAVADTARVNADIRTERAAAQQQKMLLAQLKAEEEERRSRFLADASAILDSSFDQHETLSRVGKLIVLRFADWCVLYFREGHRFRRFMAHHRESQKLNLLQEAFPEPDEANSGDADVFGAGFLGAGSLEPMQRTRRELFPTLVPDDVEATIPRDSSRRAFRELQTQSLMRTVVASHGQLVGLLIVGSGDPGRTYGVQDLQMLKDLATRIGMARESSNLYDEAQREIALRREAEARLRVFNTELERRVAERTAMLEEATREANSFAYTVAHDLRAPLRAITGFCQALKEDYGGGMDEMGNDFLDRIVSGARRMDDLIRDLLDYARLNRAEIRKGVVDLDELIEELLLPMGPELEERKARVEVTKPLGRVVGQGGVLGQALTNILSNAVKFVAPGVAPEVKVWTERKDDRLRLFVEDNGIGIAPEHHERIFGIFERLNRAEQYPGTGIGLAIVRRAVERLGGSVGVDSLAGQGSLFWVELPAP
jgi:signal transduction histidine kinase